MNGPALFTDLVSRHLATTLLHFLWQGAAVAVAVIVVSWILWHSGPKERYAISLAGLGAMVAGPPLTYAIVAQAPRSFPPSELPAAAPEAARSDSFARTDNVRVAPAPQTPDRPNNSASFESAQVWIVPVCGPG